MYCTHIFVNYVFSYPVRTDWTNIVESLLTSFPSIRAETVAVDDIQV